VIGLFLFFRQPVEPNPPVIIKESPGLLEATPSGLPEMARSQHNCYETTEDCSNFNAAAPLRGLMTFDNGVIRVDGVGIEIDGAPSVPTVSLMRLVDSFAKTKTIVHCVKNTSGKYSCATVGTNENVADILKRIVEKKH
jgi:hypothetical protein